MNRITINLWFENQAEEAAQFYTGVFPNSSVGKLARYPEAGEEITGQKPGTVMTVAFTLDGQPFVALNGGNAGFSFNEATSFIINCETQEEVDHYWQALTADGGSEVQCGWLKDKYGVLWQVIPTALDRLLADADKDKAARVMEAMLKMKKIDVAELERAAT